MGQWESDVPENVGGGLRKAGFPVVFFDAFENDYTADAFTAIAGEIIALAKAERKADEPRAQKFVQKAVGAGKVLLRSGIKLGVKAGTAGLLDAEDCKGVASDVAGELSGLTDKYLG